MRNVVILDDAAQMQAELARLKELRASYDTARAELNEGTAVDAELMDALRDNGDLQREATKLDAEAAASGGRAIMNPSMCPWSTTRRSCVSDRDRRRDALDGRDRRDGADDGARRRHRDVDGRHAGAHTIAQDEESCVVYGMPKEAVKLGGVDESMPLSRIGQAIQSLAS